MANGALLIKIWWPGETMDLVPSLSAKGSPKRNFGLVSQIRRAVSQQYCRRSCGLQGRNSNIFSAACGSGGIETQLTIAHQLAYMTKQDKSTADRLGSMTTNGLSSPKDRPNQERP
jgi:hypothetical protein